jgi:hypothetical protein
MSYKIEMGLVKTGTPSILGTSAIYETKEDAEERMNILFEQYYDFIVDEEKDDIVVNTYKDNQLIIITSGEYYFTALLVPYTYNY